MYIKVRVFPNSNKEKILRENNDHFRIYVREPAKINSANKRIIEIIRSLFPKAKNIRIINGHNSPSKLLSLE